MWTIDQRKQAATIAINCLKLGIEIKSKNLILSAYDTVKFGGFSWDDLGP